MKRAALYRFALSGLLSVCACSAVAQAKKPAATAEKAAKPVAKPQDLTPIQQLQVYVDGFHNYHRDSQLPADQQMQMRVTHYCQPVSNDFIQCTVYDGTGKNAHLIGLEHIISDPVYQSLPAEEKKYWHPHDGEVDSGMLAAPGFPDEKGLLAMIRSTHGKTWHVWDAHKDKVPMGEPSLMWAIAPHQANAKTKEAMAARKKDYKF